ncbi:MAG TPA: hypothetical protein PK747_05340 [Acidobacteriota bacterium]|nr:hypothetical protein [Acidobacteriota bacterium]HQQ46818.1 hypothetical protein [Acidobacteriota bacterium]
MKKYFILMILLVFTSITNLGDNVSFKNGRLDEGKVTILAIEKEQYIQIQTKRVMVLTEKQKEMLIKEAGIAPSVIEVFTKKVAERGIHGCGTFNIGVWFEKDKVEIPHRYLVADDKAIKMADEYDEM